MLVQVRLHGVPIKALLLHLKKETTYESLLENILVLTEVVVWQNSFVRFI